MRVYLVRHGDAIDGDHLLDDGDRWLTKRGRADALDLGRRLRLWGEVPELVVSSPLVRAVQTAELVVQGLDHAQPIAIDRAMAPGAVLGQLQRLLTGCGAESILLVGHEPHVGEFAGRLVGGGRGQPFRKAEVRRIDFAGEVEPGTGTLVFTSSPDAPVRRTS